LPEVRAEKAGLERWLSALPEAEKTALLLRFVQQGAPALRRELLNRFERETSAPAAWKAAGERRTVAALLRAADAQEAMRRQREIEAEAHRKRQEAEARAAYLDTLVPKKEQIWQQVGALLGTRRPTDHDEAVRLLVDLRDLSARWQTQPAFAARFGALRARNVRRSGLMERFARAGLPRA